MPVPSSIYDLATTAGGNSPAGSESPGTLDNYQRAQAAFIAQIRDGSINYIDSVAGTNTLTGTMTPAPTAYVEGKAYYFIPANTNTGAVTLNVNSLGARNITRAGSLALVAGDLEAGALYALVDDGTRFQLVSPSGNDRAGKSQYLTGVSGTNTVTATGSAVGAYEAGQTFRLVVANTNTGAVTININSLGAKNITKEGTTALVGGELYAGQVVEIVYDGTQFQIVSETPKALYDQTASAASGTSITFSNIPAWVSEIDLVAEGVSLGSMQGLVIQIGDSGGIETSSYIVGSGLLSTVNSFTTDFRIYVGNPAVSPFGTVTFRKLPNNGWVANSMIYLATMLDFTFMQGVKYLSAPLDRIQITRVAGAAFAGGTFYLKYR